MKKCVLLALGLSVRAVAGPIDVGGLPAWKSADTEVATNVPFAFGNGEGLTPVNRNGEGLTPVNMSQ